MTTGKTPRSVYESMTRGELIDALCAADAQPSANNVRMLERMQQERGALEEELRVLRERSERAEIARTHFADLFERAPIAYLVLDRNGVIKVANGSAVALLCTTAESLEDVPLQSIVTLETQALLDHVARCMDEGLRAVTDLKMNVPGRGEIAVQLVSTPRTSAKGFVDSVRTALHDVTRVRRAADVAQFLAQVDDVFGDALDADGTAAAIARACVPVLGDAAFVDFCDDGAFSRRAGTAFSPPHSAHRAAMDTHAADPSWRRYVERVVQEKAAVFDPSSAAAFGATIPAKGFVLVPLVGRDRVLGVLGALRIEGRGYVLDELELAQKVARRAARAIDDAELLARVRSSRANPQPLR
jgi:PAS domain S-box-containing protein